MKAVPLNDDDDFQQASLDLARRTHSVALWALAIAAFAAVYPIVDKFGGVDWIAHRVVLVFGEMYPKPASPACCGFYALGAEGTTYQVTKELISRSLILGLVTGALTGVLDTRVRWSGRLHPATKTVIGVTMVVQAALFVVGAGFSQIENPQQSLQVFNLGLASVVGGLVLCPLVTFAAVHSRSVRFVMLKCEPFIDACVNRAVGGRSAIS